MEAWAGWAAAAAILIAAAAKAVIDLRESKRKAQAEQQEAERKARKEDGKDATDELWKIITYTREQNEELQEVVSSMAREFREEVGSCEKSEGELYVWLERMHDMNVEMAEDLAALGRPKRKVPDMPKRRKRSQAGAKVEFMKKTVEQNAAIVKKLGDSVQIQPPQTFPGGAK